MKAVILCGGQGTRIRDANENLPKPMLPIGNRPMVWHIMKLYARYGITDFVLCLGYKSWVIKEYFLNYRAMAADVTVTLGNQAHSVEFHDDRVAENWKVTLAETGEITGTGGRVAAIRRYVEKDEAFCLTYGDAVSDVDIGALLKFHREHKKTATVTAVRPPGRFGELRIHSNVVSEFNEKPNVTQGFINGGFFVFDAKRIWNYLPSDPTHALENVPMHDLTKKNELLAFEHTGFWQPMDTFREYTLLNDMWKTGKAPWALGDTT